LFPFDRKNREQRAAKTQLRESQIARKITRETKANLRKTALSACAALLTLCLEATAQSYSIDWYKIAGGGGLSTGGVYSVNGTIGQQDAGGPMTGGNYSLTGGFWSLISVVQIPGGPVLTITRSGASVNISWPSPSAGFVLQQNSTVNNAPGWVNFTGTINDNGTVKSVTMTPPTGNLFFRLKQ
jgi:hypothetical protein